MNAGRLRELDQRLEAFLSDLTEGMGRSERRHWAGVYIRGLLLAGQRKSVEPMAQKIPGAGVQGLQQFVNQSPWPGERLQQAINAKMSPLCQPRWFWIIAETRLPKQGRHSAGVARQYCGTLGKIANCQVAVSLHVSGEAGSLPVGWRLYLPQEWIADEDRLQQAGIPAQTVYRSKPALAPDQWQTLAWREGAKGPLCSRFAWREVWAAHGWSRADKEPGAREVALVEWPAKAGRPVKYWLAWSPRAGDGALWELVAAAKERWRIEQDFRELKEELGLDHFEGRSWQGWHHHITLVTAAFAFLRAEGLRIKKNVWREAAAEPA